MRLAILFVLLCACALANKDASEEKPRCRAKIAGDFWPDEANHDSKLASDLSRQGELEICTRTMWGYRWKSPTVNIRQIRKKHSRPQTGEADRR